MPWLEILMLAIGVALLVAMICGRQGARTARVRGIPVIRRRPPRTPSRNLKSNFRL